MRSVLFGLLILCFGITVAQKNSIKGVVFNEKTQETIPFANVLLKNGGELKTAISNENGVFFLENLSKKQYQLTIQALGYKGYTKLITFQNTSDLDLSKIYLEEEAVALEDVIIRSETTSVEQKVDRVVVNIGKDLTSVGTDAASVLNNVQSVTVDEETGELSLRGNTNVVVLIDGKPTTIPTDQLIKQLPANAIKSVEIITNPSAKYSPEGNSGILNIKLLKNNRKGFNAGISTSASYGRNFMGSLGGNLNYKVKNVNFYANYSLKKGKREVEGLITRADNLQETLGLDDKDDQFLKFGSDIDLNKTTTLSLFTIQSFNDLHYSNNAIITERSTKDTINDNLFALDRKTKTQAYDVSLYKTYDKDQKHSLQLGVSYRNRKAPEGSQWKDSFDKNNLEQNYTEEIESDSDRWFFNMDYTQPIGGEIDVEAGIDVRLWDNQNENNSTQQVQNLNGEDVVRGLTAFTFKRNIYAGYLNYKQKLDRLTIQAGLRTEFYNLSANFRTDVDNLNETVVDEVPSLYPSFFTTYQINEQDQLKFSYSRRVDRPSIKQLTPIRRWGTPLIISIGNPDLKQQFTNSFELGYNKKLKKGTLSVTTFYRRVYNFISRTLTEDTQVEDRLVMSYGNFDTTDNYGVELATYLKLTDWWSFNGSTDLYYLNQQGLVNGEQTSVDNVQLKFRVSSKFFISDKLSFQASQLYRGKTVNIQNTRAPMAGVNVAASYKVFKEKGTISLGFRDVFNTYNARLNITNPIEQQAEYDWESQRVTFGFNYTFGNQFKKKKKPKRLNAEKDF